MCYLGMMARMGGRGIEEPMTVDLRKTHETKLVLVFFTKSGGSRASMSCPLPIPITIRGCPASPPW